MSVTELYLLLLIAPALAGAAMSLIPGKETTISRISILFCSISCLAGCFAFLALTELPLEAYSLEWSPFFGQYAIKMDSLSAVMVSVSSAVFLLTILHLAAMPDKCDKRIIGITCILFIAIILGLSADTVILLLVSWEMLTVTTFLMTKGADEVHRWRYVVITHLGGLIIMSVFAYMWVVNGTDVLSMMPLMGGVDANAATILIILLFIGFGTKLGLIPFHSWMPDLYSSAPVHSVTLLSTVCSNVAVILLTKATFYWIGVPDNPYLPLAIIALASFGSIWGAMESLIQTEPRRTLAYSSMENMSMVILCLGMSILFESEFHGDLSALMIAAAVLHTINHSVFKALMLLNIGTVETLTGEHNIDRMGGLALFMPILSFFAIIGTLSMAAIPPLNGFVSEWLMIKTVVIAGTGNSVLNVVLPLVIAVLGITGTMAAVSYARLYGFIFLGRPRSESIPKAEKMTKGMAGPLGALSLFCIALGVCAMPVLEHVLKSITETLHLTPVDPAIITDAMNPAMIAIILSAICVIIYVLFRLFSKKSRKTPTWDCGRDINKDMQYSSEGFAQPLVRVFHPFYGDKSEVKDVTGGTDTFRIIFTEPFIRYILTPVGTSVAFISRKVGKLQSGNIQSYLAYLLITLIVVLLAVRFI